MTDYESKQIREYLSCRRLGAEEEDRLIKKAQFNNDKNAQNEILNCHLYLVALSALKWKFGPLSLCDLMHEGIEGILDALRKYDKSYGTRFGTFAKYDIKGRMLKAIQKELEIQRKRSYRLDDPVITEDGEYYIELIPDCNTVTPDIPVMLGETQKALGIEFEILAEFVDGSIVSPFQRQQISNRILRADYATPLSSITFEVEGFLFSGSNPFERCNIFRKILAL